MSNLSAHEGAVVNISIEQKYRLYEQAVQNPQNDIDFINEEFKKLVGRKALTLREDFGGTGALACLWTKQSSKHHSWAVDLSSEPIEYGRNNHFARLTTSEQKRMHYVQANVLEVSGIRADVVVAFNFSYFIFKKRVDLLKYFKEVKKSLGKDCVFFIDLFGGWESQQVTEEKTDHGKFIYYWDCEEFNPISNECFFSIHFKLPGKKKLQRVFTYDWRLWNLSELRDILAEAGFKKTVAYWEGDDGKGAGDGVFYPTETGENCESWVTYIAAIS